MSEGAGRLKGGPFRPPCGRVALPWGKARVAAAAALLALVAALLVGRLPLILSPVQTPVPRAIEAAAVSAEAAMRAAEALLYQEKVRTGRVVDPALDPHRTGLIGEELTPLTTTLGSLAAKQTAAQPGWASELTRRLWRAGVRRGDLVAAGFSGSFPGLNLAVALACQSLGAELGAVSSITASTYGANQPGFTWPEMEARLVRAGLLTPVSLAVAAGGDEDRAADLDPEGQQLAQAIAARTAKELGAAHLTPPGFSASVAERLVLYGRWAKGRRLALYVNAGGTEASLGRSASVLRLKSGFLPPTPFDFSPGRGVMARMAEAGVPVLHLLNVRDLALRWGVPLGE